MSGVEEGGAEEGGAEEGGAEEGGAEEGGVLPAGAAGVGEGTCGVLSGYQDNNMSDNHQNIINFTTYRVFFLTGPPKKV